MMVRVNIDSVRVSLMSQHRVVVLKDADIRADCFPGYAQMDQRANSTILRIRKPRRPFSVPC